MELLDLTLRILTGLLLGAAVGFERQLRSRTAGVRTNALVSLGAALFVIMGAFSFTGAEADPTRVAAQIVSGIGFLGAGVIMKQGASISGLNTAATLWASAAVGALAGGGMYLVALGGTAAIVLSNIVLRPLGRLLDRAGGARTREPVAAEYEFVVRSAAASEVAVRSQVVAALQHPEFTVHSLEANDVSPGEVELTARLVARERNDAALETAIADVVPVPEVTSVRWRASELRGED
ncbi:Protein MgtC [Leucobacter aridicollis]|uniref:MgtC/SapB family protein n=1 Tax=Leucobacter aridicollis TaxID=283878 RepID=UPI00216801A8|nr:MgtC/SapB family protein [Leucobacter aridicollis]MCS3427808.1 putative Mg2+ transporter-C (MgtC) family protein [Leucobacter aridicollis]